VRQLPTLGSSWSATAASTAAAEAAFIWC